ncbi:hypothetical protein WN944_010450 [Citrus x changshan-huyou]|uniref:Uncharacterized protein n=1 Tax=Citrus x changshan-huyou TaxID=2935761 RepID=A0AAP0MUX8_9ROSI
MDKMNLGAMQRFYFRNQTNNGKEEGTNVNVVRKEYVELRVLSIDEMGEKLTAYDFHGSTSFASGIKNL